MSSMHWTNTVITISTPTTPCSIWLKTYYNDLKIVVTLIFSLIFSSQYLTIQLI